MGTAPIHGGVKQHYRARLPILLLFIQLLARQIGGADARYWGNNGSRGNPGSSRLRAEDEEFFPVIFRPEPLSSAKL